MKKLSFTTLESIQAGNKDLDAFLDGCLCGASVLAIGTFWGALGSARCLGLI